MTNIHGVYQNAAAMNIRCKICFQTFMTTTKEPEYVISSHCPARDNPESGALKTSKPGELTIHRLKRHAEDKHTKAVADCFPNGG